MLDALFAQDLLWFSIPALAGTGVFLMRMTLMLLGGLGDAGLGDAEYADASGSDADGSESEDAFKLLSIQSLAAFAMGFGWAGVGAMAGAGWSAMISLTIATAGGAGMVWLLSLLLKLIYDLESSGNLSIHSALGAEGEVYLRIPAVGGGRGQVKLTLQQRQRIYNAVSDGEEILTHARVRVTRVNDDNTLTVQAV